MKQSNGPLPSSELTCRRGGRLDRADPAGECRSSHSTGELALGCGDDQDHPGNRSRVTPKGEPAQGLTGGGISLSYRNSSPPRPQAAMTTREPPTAGAALAFTSRVTLKGDFSYLGQDPAASGVYE